MLTIANTVKKYDFLVFLLLYTLMCVVPWWWFYECTIVCTSDCRSQLLQSIREIYPHDNGAAHNRAVIKVLVLNIIFVFVACFMKGVYMYVTCNCQSRIQGRSIAPNYMLSMTDAS